jgi:hypothetical protein
MNQKHADINHRKTVNPNLSARAQDAQLNGGGVDGEAAARWRGALAVSRPCGGAAVPRRTVVGGRRRVRAGAGSRPGGGVEVPRRLDGAGRGRGVCAGRAQEAAV